LAREQAMRRINLKKVSVARSDRIRSINRQIVLNYVREKSPISRAEIAQETALQRSTVSLIVDDLKARGLIDETEGESTGGRPPILLRLRTAEAVAIGIDLGTKDTTIAASDLAGRVLTREIFPTDPDPVISLDNIIEAARKLMSQHPGVEGIGVSVPGLVDAEQGTAIFVPHFKWRDMPIAQQLEAALGLPVRVDNDANALALAELWFGRPEIHQVRDFIAVLVEEGLGTGVVFDGQVYHGVAGGAGEFGHMTIGADAPISCASGSRECWEAFASERAALARYAERRGPSEPNHVSFDVLMDRALAGEEAASGALLETAHYLGLGISNLIKGLSPEAVIIGGDIAKAWRLIESSVQKAAEANAICRGLAFAKIIPSTLGQSPRLMGALSLVLAAKFASLSED
jgi:predicted NBD/HSP70 family sugar kinase